jgi:hypothetical protein
MVPETAERVQKQEGLYALVIALQEMKKTVLELELTL